MNTADNYRAAVEIMRGWGFEVREVDGCYSRSNGGGWAAGVPVGHINHHFVCSMNPSDDYISSMIDMLVASDTVHWFADVNGVAHLVGAAGPMNHAGTGNSSVLNRTKSGQAPSGPAGSSGDISGNPHYSGTECQHPGDSTPWPQPMLDVMVAINAAEFLVWNYGAERAINHFEWTNRKIDMSAGGGAGSGGWAGEELRRRVAVQMGGGSPEPPKDWFDMATEDDLRRIVREEIAAAGPTIGVDVWSTSINDRGNAAAHINQASAMAQSAADGIGPLPVRIWDQHITGDTDADKANALLAKAANEDSPAPTPPVDPPADPYSVPAPAVQVPAV